jgi:hypothetical protein
VVPRRATAKSARRRVLECGNGPRRCCNKIGVVQPGPGNVTGILSNFWPHPPLPTTGEAVSVSPHRLSTEAVTAIGDKWAIPGQTRDGIRAQTCFDTGSHLRDDSGTGRDRPGLERHRAAPGRWLAGHRISRPLFSATAHSSFACWRKAIRTRETLRARRRISAKRSSSVSASVSSQDWATLAKAERG